MANVVVAVRLIRACVTRHGFMAMDNSIQKGNPTEKRCKNESVLEGWYQAWISQMIAKGFLKISSGTVPHDMTREAWGTSSNLEASYILHSSETVKYGIAEYNTSYNDTVDGSE